MSRIGAAKQGLRRRVLQAGSTQAVSDLILKLPVSATPPHLDSVLAQQLSVNGDLDNARSYFNRALSTNPRNSSWQYKLGVVEQRCERYAEAAEAFTRAITVEDIGKYRYHRAQAYMKIGHVHDAIDDLFKATASSAPEPRAYGLLYNLIVNANITQSEQVRYLRRGIELGIAQRDWILHLARTAYAQELTEESIHWYEQVSNRGEFGVEDSYRYGLSLHATGRIIEANRQFELAMRKLGKKRPKFGLGSLHASKGNWPLAKEYFLQQTPPDNRSGDFYYQTGMAHDRSYDWSGAERFYSLALAEDQSHPYWWWRLGFVSEKQKKYAQAARFYAKSGEMKPSLNGWYHAGRMHVQSQQYESARYCFRKFGPYNLANGTSEPLDDAVLNIITAERNEANTPSSAKTDRTIGLALVRSGYFRRALWFLKRAVCGLSDHDQKVRFAYALALERTGNTSAALDMYVRMMPIQRPDGVGKSIKMSSTEELHARYLAYREELPVDQNVVLYEVGHGSSVGCNPGAIYRYLSKRSKYRQMTHVWVVEPDTAIPIDVLADAKVTIVYRETDLYYRYLATAKYLINNTSFGSYFIRREGQKYLNTWHGTPFKTLGRSVKNEILNYGNISRNLLHVTHLAVGNEWTAETLLREHQVDTIFSGRIYVSGSPRVDAVIGAASDEDIRMRQRLGLREDLPFLVYAPTWKGSLETEMGIVDGVAADIQVIDEMEAAGYQVRYSAHRFVYEAGYAEALGNYLIPKDEDLNRILSIADVLVTDYSSVFFDWLPTRRPVIFYAPDYSDYAESRGLYDIALPGPVCSNVEALVDQLVHLDTFASEYQETFADAIDEYAVREDGLSTFRVVSWFFDEADVDDYTVSDASSYSFLFRHSFIPNGIAASFRALTSALQDGDAGTCYVLMDRASILSDPDRGEQLDLLGSDVRLLPRAGRTLYTVEERWLDRKDKNSASPLSLDQERILARAYSREFARIFGPTEFDVACEFDGYSRFWTRVLGDAGHVRSKAIYLHNNMLEEHRTKHPELHSVFPLYKKYDALISVSESVNRENCGSLSELCGVDVERFVWADNVVDVGRVLVSAREPIPDEYSEFISRPGILAVSVGRLSVEKGHDRLIRGLLNAPESINLVILGGGPEEDSLRSLVRRLGLSSRVLITGHLVNPFPIMAAADVITLLSRWEGQGLSLLEAMILGCNIIATDIPGPRSIVQAYGGTLVSNSAAGIDDAFALIGERAVDASVFDADSYNSIALNRFLSAVGVAPLCLPGA